jgi:SAM-dependent methyltransferase
LHHTAGRELFDAASYDRIAPGYYDRAYRRKRGVQAFWQRQRLQLVEAQLPAGASAVLDVGCGPGTFLGNLKRPPQRRLGLDLAAGQIEYARATYAGAGLEFRVQDVRTLAIDERFDAAVSVEVIEHLPAAAAAELLAAIRGALRPGGVLVLTTPNRRSHWPLVERLVSRLGPVDYRAQHINLYDAARLACEVVASGFEVTSLRTFFVVAPFAAAFSTALAALLLRAERRVLPRLGCELLIVARRPFSDARA